MTYVQRKNGTVVGEYRWPLAGVAEELLPDDHPDVVAYRAPKPAPVSDLEAIKAALLRKGTITQGDIDSERSR